MNLASLTPADLKHIASLLERRASLQEEAAKIEAQLSSYGSGAAKVPRKSPGRPPGRPPGRRASGPRQKRGKLKETIVGILKEAGKDGITVKEIAKKAAVKPQNVYMWFYTTGKKMKEIKKIGDATHRWEG